MTTTVPTPTIDDVEYLEGQLFIPEGLPYADWEVLGERLQFRERNIGFWLGDWWRYGEHRYGEAASQAAPSGYAAETCRNAAHVAEVFQPARRRANVPFGHHQALAALPPEVADEFLDEVVASVDRGEPMRRQQLRAKVRRWKEAEDPDPGGTVWTLTCVTCAVADGPTIDCRAGVATVARDWLCAWLSDHEGHDVRLPMSPPGPGVDAQP